MRRLFLRFTTVFLFAVTADTSAYARSIFDTWQSLREPGVESIRFEEGAAFLKAHPGWPEEKIIRLRTEAAAFGLLTNSSVEKNASAGAVAAFCKDFPPISGRGMFACVSARAEDEKTRSGWLKQGWIQGDFSADEEARLLSYHGPVLAAFHRARMDRLLYERKADSAQRLLPRIAADYHPLYHARLAFVRGEKRAPIVLKQLSRAQMDDPGLLYDRARWRQSRSDPDFAELVALAPANAPYPELWWPLRAAAIRQAILQRRYARAAAMTGNTEGLKPEAKADALFLKGWLALRGRKPRTAYEDFYALYEAVNTPVSKARAAYWAGRAAQANHNHDIATSWMKRAAKHPSVFYGQIAAQFLKETRLSLPEEPSPTSADEAAFSRLELAQALQQVDSGDHRMVTLFTTALAERIETASHAKLLVETRSEQDGNTGAVATAKLVLRRDYLLPESGWPLIELPGALPIEPALALAIIRQESEFDPEAKSPVGATGMMQLMPGTARHVTGSLGFRYDASLLTSPDTNILLGSEYLGRLIRGFDGSYILAIAAYNAGPANVRKWIAQLGSPPRDLEGALNWIESIPFTETRNYVMRVMENLAVYRERIKPGTALTTAEDLQR